MLITTLDARRLGHADHSSNSDYRVRASFARQATIAAFGCAAGGAGTMEWPSARHTRTAGLEHENL